MQKLLRFYPSFLTGLSLLPLIAAAQPAPTEVNTLIDQVKATFNLVITALFVIATIIFIWGVIKYVIKSDDEKARAQAKGLMLWGIVGLAVITAVWGVVNLILIYFFGSASEGVQGIPTIPGEF